MDYPSSPIFTRKCWTLTYILFDIVILTLISRSSFFKVRQQEKETSTLLRQKMKNTKDKKLKMLISHLKVDDLYIYIYHFRHLTFQSLFLLQLMKTSGFPMF